MRYPASLALLAICLLAPTVFSTYDSLNIEGLHEDDPTKSGEAGHKLNKFLDQHFHTADFSVSRRKFIEILFEYHFPDLSFETGRMLQTHFNKGERMHSKEERSIAKDMNMLDKIKATVMSKAEAHRIIASKEFRNYRNREWGNILMSSKAYVRDQGVYHAHYDDHQHNRDDKYGYEYSHRGYKEDLREQHLDVMEDRDLDLWN